MDCASGPGLLSGLSKARLCPCGSRPQSAATERPGAAVDPGSGYDDLISSSEELVCVLHVCMCVCVVRVCVGEWGDGVYTLLGTGEAQTFSKKNQRGLKA